MSVFFIFVRQTEDRPFVESFSSEPPVKMTTVIPKNMQLVAQRLANMERTTIRVRPQSNDAVQSGSTIHFRLPTNTLIDLHNLQFFGTCKLNVTSGDTCYGLPSSMQQAIERVDVVVNGQSVYGSNNDYGGIEALLQHYTSARNSREIADYLTSGDNKIITKPTSTGSDATDMREILKNNINGTDDTGNTYGSSAGGASGVLPYKFPFLLKGLLGLLSGKYVRFIDTAVLGPVEIRIRLQTPNVLWRGLEGYNTEGVRNTSSLYNTNSTPPEFSFEQMYMYLDTIAFADDFYRLLLANRLAQGGIITIPFENYHSFGRSVNSNSDTISFNLATQSLNMLIATLRDSNYNRRYAKKYSEYAGNTNYYAFVSGDDSDYANDGPYSHKTMYQYQINNKPVPSFPANVDEAHALTLAALDLNADKNDVGHAQNYLQYRQGQFAFVQNFAHHGESENVISGLDTRGASSNMYFAMENLDISSGKAYQVTIYAVTTATLEISAGQNVTLIL